MQTWCGSCWWVKLHIFSTYSNLSPNYPWDVYIFFLIFEGLMIGIFCHQCNMSVVYAFKLALFIQRYSSLYSVFRLELVNVRFLAVRVHR